MWRTGSSQGGLQGVIEALAVVQSQLGEWGQHEFGNMQKKVRRLQARLDKLRCASLRRGPTEEEISVAKQLREDLRQEEIWLKQRSRVSWLREGDRNTGYFQAQAAQRKRINRITSLEADDGRVCTDPAEVKTVILGFYQAL